MPHELIDDTGGGEEVRGSSPRSGGVPQSLALTLCEARFRGAGTTCMYAGDTDSEDAARLSRPPSRTERPDLAICNDLCVRVHGHDRGGELNDAIQQGTAVVAESEGRIRAYASSVAFFGRIKMPAKQGATQSAGTLSVSQCLQHQHWTVQHDSHRTGGVAERPPAHTTSTGTLRVKFEAQTDYSGSLVLTPGTLIDGARMYAAAADAVNDRYPNSMHVLSHLIGMAIELVLKAFLLNHGRTERDLRQLGHDLPRLLEECESLGLAKTGSRHFRVSVLGANYEDRLFAYPEKGVLTAITPGSLRQIANELIQEVFISMKGEKNFNELRGAPGLCVQSVYSEDLNASAWAVHP